MDCECVFSPLLGTLMFENERRTHFLEPCPNCHEEAVRKTGADFTLMSYEELKVNRGVFSKFYFNEPIIMKSAIIQVDKALETCQPATMELFRQGSRYSILTDELDGSTDVPDGIEAVRVLGSKPLRKAKSEEFELIPHYGHQSVVITRMKPKSLIKFSLSKLKLGYRPFWFNYPRIRFADVKLDLMRRDHEYIPLVDFASPKIVQGVGNEEVEGDNLPAMIAESLVDNIKDKYTSASEMLSLTKQARSLSDHVNETLGKKLEEITAVLVKIVDRYDEKSGVPLADSLDRVSQMAIGDIQVKHSLGAGIATSVCEKLFVICGAIYLIMTFSDWTQTAVLISTLLASAGTCSRIVDWYEQNETSMKDLFKLRWSNFTSDAKKFFGTSSDNVTPAGPDIVVDPGPSGSGTQQIQEADTGIADFGMLVAPMASILASGIVTVMSTMDTRSLPQFIKAGQCAQSFNNIRSMGDAIKKSLEYAKEIVWGFATGLPKNLKDFTEFESEVVEWTMWVDNTIGDESWVKELYNEPTKRKSVHDMMRQGQQVYSVVKDLVPEKRNALLPYINSTIARISRVQKMLATLESTEKQRCHPVSFVLQGHTKIGKSKMVKQMAIDLFGKMPFSYRKGFIPSRLVFNKAPEATFYDGYDSHFMLACDELFQSNDKTKRDDQCSQIFQLINDFSQPLDMAACELKNKICINSPFISFTTNLDDWDRIDVLSIAALKRRRGYLITPTVKDQFSMIVQGQEKCLDSDKWVKYAKDNNLKVGQPNYATFTVKCGETERILHNNVTYQEVIDFLFSQYEVNNSIHTLIDNEQQEQFAQFLKEDPEPEEVEVPDIDEESDDRFSSRMWSSRILEKNPTFMRYELAEVEDLDDHIIRTQLKYDYAYTEDGTKKDSAWTDKWNSFSKDTKIEVAVVIASVCSLEFPTRSQILREAFSLGKDEERFLNTGPTWKAYVEASKKHKFPKYNWTSKIRSIFRNWRSTFPFTEVFVVLTSMATIVGLFFLMRHLFAKQKGKTESDVPLITRFKEKACTYMGLAKDESMDTFQNVRNGNRKYGTVKKGRVRAVATGESFEELTSPDIVNNYNIINSTECPKIIESGLDIDSEALCDPAWESSLPSMLANLAEIDLVCMGQSLSKTKGIFIKAQMLLFPSHLLERCVDSSSAYLCISTASFTINVLMQDISFQTIGDIYDFDDLTVAKLPLGKGMCRDIIHLFSTQKEIETYDGGYGELIVPQGHTLFRHVVTIEKQSVYLKENPNAKRVIYSKGDGPNRYATNGWHYKAATQAGFCGSPLIRWSSTHKGKIIGIHAAGDTGTKKNLGSFAAALDREFLLDACSSLDSLAFVQESKDVGRPFFGTSHLYKPAMSLIAYVPKELTVFIPTKKSSITASDFQPRLAVAKTTPTITSREPGQSLDNVLSKYVSITPLVDNPAVDLLTRCLYLKSQIGNDKNPVILTWDQAVKGLDNLSGINPQSSMGYPYVLNQQLKTDVLTLSADGYSLREDTLFYKELLEKEEKLSKRIIPEWIWVTYTKDERLPREKVIVDGKIRLFMSCPFDLTLLVRKYFGSFIDVIHRERFRIGCMVGIDPHSEEWTHLANLLREKSTFMSSEDFSNWDRTVPLEFLNVFFVMAGYYYDGLSNIQQSLQRVLLAPTYQTDQFRYTTVSGNPSGSPITSEANSLANVVLTLYVLRRLGIPLQTIFSGTYLATYGDDKVMATTFDYDMVEYVKEMKELGMNVTSTKKDGSLPTLLPIEDIDFLQRKFELRGSRYWAPLPTDTLIEAMLWVGCHENMRETLTDTIRSVFVELQQHDASRVPELYVRILDCCSWYRYEFPITEHLITSLNTHFAEPESWSGSFLESVLLKMGGAVWNQSISYTRDRATVTSYKAVKDYQCVYVGLDIVQTMPVVTKGVFIHSGFRFVDDAGNYFPYELVMSGIGVAWVPAKYKPDFAQRVTLNHSVVIHHINNQKPYHKVLWNCVRWAESIMEGSDIDDYPKIGDKLIKFCEMHHPKFLEAPGMEAEADNSTLSTTVSDRPVLEETLTGPIFRQASNICSPAQTREFGALLDTYCLLDTGYWRSEPVDSELVRIDLPNKLLASRQFRDKMSYNALFSATIEIKLVVSTTPFQAGLLLMVWEPLGQYGMPGNQRHHVFSQTAMPSVIFDAANGEVCILKIPFLSPYSYCRLVGSPKFGYIRIKVLSPLNQVGDTSATWSLYGKFSHIEVMAPTSATRLSSTHSADVYPGIQPQASETEEKSKQGIISGIATKVESVATLFSRIPWFYGPMSAVATVARVTKTIATYMGLSKPNSLAATIPVIPRPFSCVSYSDGLDLSTIIGTSPKNHVVIQPALFCSQVDESSILFVAKTPQIIDQFPWRAVSDRGQILRTYPVVPTLAGKINGFDASKFAQLSPMGYTAICAKYWRGSIQFKIQVASTSYHRGLISVAFVPLGCDRSYKLETVSNFLLDLGEKKTLEFTAPFVSDRFFNKVPDVFDTIKMTESYASGTVIIKVVNPLVHPETVESSIIISVWVSAAGDFEMAVPTLDQVQRLHYGYGKEYLREGEAVATVETENDAFDLLTDMDSEMEAPVKARSRSEWQMGDSARLFDTYTTTDCDTTDLVMGESIHNLRDMLKIFCRKFEAKTPAQEQQVCYDLPVHSYSTHLKNVEDTFYDHFTRMYRMSRGSIRHKLITNNFGGKMSVVLNLDSDKKPFQWYSSNLVREGSPWGLCVPGINNTFEYMVPFYSQEKFVIHGQKPNPRGVTLCFRAFDKPKEGDSFYVEGYEAIGDDFSLGYLTGPPVVYPKKNHEVEIFDFIEKSYLNGHTQTKIDDVNSYTVLPSYGYLLVNRYSIPTTTSCWAEKTEAMQDYMLNMVSNPEYHVGTTPFEYKQIQRFNFPFGRRVEHDHILFIMMRHFSTQTEDSRTFQWFEDTSERWQGAWFSIKIVTKPTERWGELAMVTAGSFQKGAVTAKVNYGSDLMKLFDIEFGTQSMGEVTVDKPENS